MLEFPAVNKFEGEWPEACLFTLRNQTVEETVILKFDIFRRLPDGQPLWVQAVEGLEEAKMQLARLVQANPGEYFIFDMSSSAIVYTRSGAT